MEQRAKLQSVGLAALFAGLVSLGLHLALGDVNLNLADEGYLWYGVLGVLEGEVPFRDFQAYDPGRYHWCALWSKLFGTGILGVRASLALFQALGLCAGLLVLRRFLKHDLWMLPLALLLGLWMFPRHKLFEPALAMLVVWSAVRLLEQPSVRRHLESGLCVGLVAWFGRNHGFYAGLGMGTAWLFLLWKRPAPGALRRLGGLALGVLLGYLPMLGSLALVPGMGAAYWTELTSLARKGANLPLDYPWPWSASWSSGASGLELVAEWSTNLAFALPLLILPLALWRLVRLGRLGRPGHEAGAQPEARGFSPEQAALIGSSLIGLIYMHHASVRSDAQHLAQCIQPLLLAALALTERRATQVAGVLGLAALTFFFSLQNHSTLRFFAPWRPPYTTVEQQVAGETLRLNAAQASYIKTLMANVGVRLKPKDEIFIAPARATLYPVLGKRAPVPEIYMVWPASEAEQQAMIANFEARELRWALIVEVAVDKREDLLFSRTHPLVWQHLKQRYREVPSGLGRNQHLFRRRP